MSTRFEFEGVCHRNENDPAAVIHEENAHRDRVSFVEVSRICHRPRAIIVAVVREPTRESILDKVAANP